MTLSQGSDSLPLETRGEVRFVDSEARVRLQSAVEAAGWMLVSTEPFGPGACGLLDKLVEEEVEQALQKRGAPSPGTSANSSFDELLDDQLLRARSAGISGIAIALGPLGGMVTTTGALDPEDSATLRRLAAACQERAIALWLAPVDEATLGYAQPVPLREMLKARRVAAAAEAPPPAVRAAEPQDGEGDDASPLRWRIFMRELDAAQGPKPLAVVEKLFIERYVPLAEAVARGETEARARQALTRFSRSFEKSYREAFAAARATRRRPPMVLDVPQIAARAARLHGARNVTLLLVDGMRFDVGARVQQLLKDELGADAVCAEQYLLWAALPTTTQVQLELIARGPQGLAEMTECEPEQELIVSHGKAATVVRRVRAGGRELHKLDIVQAMIGEKGPREPDRIEAIARQAAVPIAKFARSLPARTLLFVFGDHGFEFPVADLATGAARQGGATPEQVLVPGHVWLIGGVH